MTHDEYIRSMDAETERHRTIIGWFCVAVLFLLLSPCFGQDVITAKNFDPHETYILQYPTGYYIHPNGHTVATILVKAESTGVFYRVAIRQEYLDGMKPGDEVEIEPTAKP